MKIFVSYRRQDNSYAAGWIHDRLSREYGSENVFMDVDLLLGGEPFKIRIEDEIKQCDVFLPVIGPDWQGFHDSGAKARIFDENDFVKMETEVALKFDKKIIPLFVDGVTGFHPKDIPPSLLPITEKNGIKIRPNPDFTDDLDTLINWINADKKIKESRTFHRHTYYINAIDISFSGKWMASIGGDRNAIFWDLSTGEVIRSFKHNRWGGNVKLIADTDQIITTDGNGFLRVWNSKQAIPLIEKHAHQGACRALDITTDGQFYATGGGDKLIHFWQSSKHVITKTFEGHTSEVRKVVFSPSGKELVSVGEDGKVLLWDIETGEHITLFDDHEKTFRGVSLSSDGHWAAALDSDGTLFVFDVINNQLYWQVKGHEGPGVGIDFQGVNIIATGGYDNLVRLWDVKEKNLIDTISGHSDAVTAVKFHPDGTRLYSAGRDKIIREWELKLEQ